MESLGGLEVASDEGLEVDRVTIGRGTDQHVVLTDIRVTLAHAEIRLQPGGGYRIECQGPNPVWLNGSPVQGAALGVGDIVDLGRYRVVVGDPEPGTDLLLTIEERVSAREAQGSRRGLYLMSLEQAGLGRRRWAWALAALVLGLLLLLPVALRFGPSAVAGPSVDALWQAGPSSGAHGGFIEECSRCHQAPFTPVGNAACLDCHRDQPHHSTRPELIALPGLAEARCGSCHGEHNGRDGLVARNPELCTDCHAKPDERFAEAKLEPAARFDDAHPDFSFHLPAWQDGEASRVELTRANVLREEPHLLFPHDLHLVAAGVASPDGKRVMACADCHVAAGEGFQPLRMQDQCASCHRLEFDTDAPARELPHGLPQQVSAIIRGHFARMALAGEVKDPAAPAIVRLLRRPGEVLAPAQAQAALAWADERAALAIADVFERRVCGSCHVVTATPGDADAPYRIDKPALTQRYLTGARFDHAAHRTENCSRCHDAKASKTSADLLLPGVDNCRGCHADQSTGTRVGTTCVDCHGFHITGTMGAPAPRKEPAP